MTPDRKWCDPLRSVDVFGKGCDLPGVVSELVELVEEDRHEEMLAASDKVIALYGKSAQKSEREYVAYALYSKGFALFALGRIVEAHAAWRALVKHFAIGESDWIDYWLQEARAQLVNQRGREFL